MGDGGANEVAGKNHAFLWKRRIVGQTNRSCISGQMFEYMSSTQHKFRIPSLQKYKTENAYQICYPQLVGESPPWDPVPFGGSCKPQGCEYFARRQLCSAP